jgi:hypothetical protein
MKNFFVFFFFSRTLLCIALRLLKEIAAAAEQQYLAGYAGTAMDHLKEAIVECQKPASETAHLLGRCQRCLKDFQAYARAHIITFYK